MEEINNESTSTQSLSPKVTGVGGIFFFCENPKETREWYQKNLGIDMQNPDEINILQWSPFKQGSDYFAPSKKEFMINYRVQNIEGLLKQLRQNGVTILDEIQSYDYGKFLHIMDAEGNKIELWEPA